MLALQNLYFTDRDFNIKVADCVQYIFDICRKKFVVLTPEEWVRQHLIWSLVHDFNFPKGKISVEKWVQLGERRKRFDALVYNQDSEPWILIECKEPNVELSDATFIQLSQYQQVVGAQYLMLTNGNASFLAEIKEQKIIWQTDLPDYQ